MDTYELEIAADKTFRRDLDYILQSLKLVAERHSSRERAIAITKLQESIMWMGMDLKRLGTPNPYPNSKDPSNTIVDATADALKL